MRRVFAILCVLVASVPLRAADIRIVVLDPSGHGFNDTTPATPVGGNTGTTVGEQRLKVFEEAARVWGQVLPGTTPIRVEASFAALQCSETSAVVGQAYALNAYSGFPGAPLPGTYYVKALADQLRGHEIDPGTNAIHAEFNGSLGQSGCLTGLFFYYGLDALVPSGLMSLLPVVVHELGHGLGFVSGAGGGGAFAGGLPMSFDRMLLDAASGKTWDQLTGVQRAASSTNTGLLVWAGAAANAWGTVNLGPKARLVVTSPAGVAGTYRAIGAQFGPPLSELGVTGTLVTGAGSGCSAFGASLAGQIALIDRNTSCSYTTKAKNAQNAGAAAVVFVYNATTPQVPPISLTGSDPTITIPSILIDRVDGVALRASSSVQATVGVSYADRAGADASGRILMYAPSPYQGGSNVSHWDQSSQPPLLMQPFISPALLPAPDATLAAFRDIGWFSGAPAVRATYLLPSAAHAPGKNNAFYTTDLSVANRGTGAATLTLKFLGHDLDGTGGPEVVRMVPANASVTFFDVLGALFGVDSGYGAVLVTADSADLRLVSQTSTPTSSGTGTFGQALAAQSDADFVTISVPRTLAGLRDDASFRTNLVLANASAAAAHVDLTLLDGNGFVLGVRGADLPPLGMTQVGNVVSTIAGGPASAATLTVSTSTAAVQIAAYASVIDNVTNDPRTVIGTAGVPTVFLLPSSAHAPGKNNAFYTTDITIVNTASSAASATLQFLGHDRDGRVGPSQTRSVPAAGSIALTDVLGTVFGATGGDYGAIRITTSTPGLRLTSQTSTPTPSGSGTFGQALRALTTPDFVTTASPRALLPLREDAAFRTNLVLANATEADVHVDLTLLSESGVTLGTRGVDLTAVQMTQIGNVVTDLAGAQAFGTTGAVLVVSTPTAGARVATYATVIDNTTNDPRTVLP